MLHKFSAVLVNSKSKIRAFHIDVPKDICDQLLEVKRVVCTVNGIETFQCGLLPDGSGGRLISLNKQRKKKLGLEEGDLVDLELKKDDSKYGLEMPDEMLELLKHDDMAWRKFHDLTPGKQRSLLYLVGKPKSKEIRCRKAMAVVDHVKNVGNEIDFRQLNEMFKSDKYK